MTPLISTQTQRILDLFLDSSSFRCLNLQWENEEGRYRVVSPSWMGGSYIDHEQLQWVVASDRYQKAYDFSWIAPVYHRLSKEVKKHVDNQLMIIAYSLYVYCYTSEKKHLENFYSTFYSQLTHQLSTPSGKNQMMYSQYVIPFSAFFYLVVLVGLQNNQLDYEPDILFPYIQIMHNLQPNEDAPLFPLFVRQIEQFLQEYANQYPSYALGMTAEKLETYNGQLTFYLELEPTTLEVKTEENKKGNSYD